MVWSIVTFVIVGVLFMAVERKKNAEIIKVSIGIKGIKGGRNLISKKDVNEKFRKYLGFDLNQSAIKDLNLRDMESFLKADDRIKDAEVYVDNKDRLYIAIDQRVPVVRVFSKNNLSYYLDSDGYEIPAYHGSTIRVPIASGYIEDYNPKLLTEKSKSKLKDVFEIAKYIHEDDFLTALIEQIDVAEDGIITMVPKIGRQKLVFGEANNIEETFKKLKLFYKEGLPKFGWRKWNVLTLKYDGQIVGERTKG